MRIYIIFKKGSCSSSGGWRVSRTLRRVAERGLHGVEPTELVAQRDVLQKERFAQCRGSGHREVCALQEALVHRVRRRQVREPQRFSCVCCVYIKQSSFILHKDEEESCRSLPMKSMSNLPSEIRPVGCPKKVIP